MAGPFSVIQRFGIVRPIRQANTQLFARKGYATEHSAYRIQTRKSGINSRDS